MLTLSLNNNRYDKPLSEGYILERLELDDPVSGGFVYYQKEESKKRKTKAALVAQHGGNLPVAPSVTHIENLQGFIITTDFTTWRNSLRFDR